MSIRKVKLGKSWMDDQFSEHAIETVDMFLTMDRYLTKNYGKRCPDFEAGCCVCDVWRLRDNLKKFICT